MAKANIEAVLHENEELREKVKKLESMLQELMAKLEKSQKRRTSTFLMSLPLCKNCISDEHQDVVSIGTTAQKCKFCGSSSNNNVRFVTLRFSINSISNKAIRTLAKAVLERNAEVLALAERLSKTNAESSNGEDSEDSNEEEFEF